VDWDRLGTVLFTTGLDAPDHIGAAWAVAAHVAVDVPIDIDQVQWHLDALTLLDALRLILEDR
jgi:hypothetical protein